MKEGATEAYRVIVEYSNRTVCYGPFGTLSAAKGAATREAEEGYWSEEIGHYRQFRRVPFRLQRTTSDWTDIE